MEKEPVGFFQELKEMVTDYLNARLRLLKYEIYEKTARIAAALFASLTLVLLGMLTLFFLSISLGFYLGALFNSYGAGFLAVTGFYFLLMVPFLFFRKNWVEKVIANRLIEVLTEKEEEA